MYTMTARQNMLLAVLEKSPVQAAFLQEQIGYLEYLIDKQQITQVVGMLRDGIANAVRLGFIECRKASRKGATEFQQGFMAFPD